MFRLTRRTIAIVRVGGWSVCLPVFIHMQTDYQTSYRSLPKFVPDGWSISSTNTAIHLQTWTLFCFFTDGKPHKAREHDKIARAHRASAIWGLWKTKLVQKVEINDDWQVPRKTVTKQTQNYLQKHFEDAGTGKLILQNNQGLSSLDLDYSGYHKNLTQ